MEHWKKLLTNQNKKWLSNLNIEPSSLSLLKLENYAKMVCEWNKKLNLVSKQDSALDLIFVRHVLDSLSIYPALVNLWQDKSQQKVLDLGAGAGFPSIPLAIVLNENMPEQISWVLIDSNSKRTIFLQAVVRELALKNVKIVNERSEHYTPEEKFSNIICRAFAGLGKIIQSAEHLCQSNGQIIAMKGELKPAELAEVNDPFFIKEQAALSVPYKAANRNYVIIQRNNKQ